MKKLLIVATLSITVAAVTKRVAESNRVADINVIEINGKTLEQIVKGY